MRGRTTKPCPCCKKSVFRRKDSPCSSCERILKLGRNLNGLVEKAGLEVVAVPAFLSIMLDVPYDLRDRVEKALLGILRPHALYDHWGFEGAKRVELPDGVSAMGEAAKRGAIYMVPKGVADAIMDLVASIIDVSREAFMKGREDGRSLLTGLASGEISMDDFDAKEIRIAIDRQMPLAAQMVALRRAKPTKSNARLHKLACQMSDREIAFLSHHDKFTAATDQSYNILGAYTISGHAGGKNALVDTKEPNQFRVTPLGREVLAYVRGFVETV